MSTPAMRAEGESADAEAWRSSEPPKDGSAFQAYHPSLVHADFNPQGVVEVVWSGEGFIGAVWNGCQDCWETQPVEVAMWRPIVGPFAS